MSKIQVKTSPSAQRQSNPAGGSHAALEPQNSDGISSRSKKRLGVTAAGIVSTLLVVGYFVAFVNSFDGRWFNPEWTTDDATQQTYPFYDAIYPGVFENDLITDVMRGCLPPVHYWVSYAVTTLTGDPIMTGHWVMLIQLSLAVVFSFLAVRALTSNVPAALAVLWLLHSRNTMQRMTGGLPRGWTPAIFAAFLYFATTKRHWAAMATILLGSMLNPPGALIVGVAYGFLLVWRYVSSSGEDLSVARRNLLRSVAVSPLFVLVALLVVQRPAHVGQMVSFSEASAMPEFQRPLGRFPFLPLRPIVEEFQIFGYQAFIGRLYRPALFWRQNMLWFIPGALAVIAGIGMLRRRIALPAEVVLFGMASLTTYVLSRIFAFRLFVPDRHLQIPMVFFMVFAFVVGIWRAFHRTSITEQRKSRSVAPSALANSWPALLVSAALGVVVYQCSNSGLQGDANFNYPMFKRGHMYEWVRDNTAQDSLIACHPTHCDGMQLFAVRRAFVTTETSHPFYPRYNLEMRRRSEISLRAHYAQSLSELVSLLQPEGVTHFIFRRADFRPERLAKATYFPPLDKVVDELLAKPRENLAFHQLPKSMDPSKFPYVKFIDDVSIIIDIRALANHLQAHGWAPSQSSMSASMERHAATRRAIYASGQVDVTGFPS
jgi:hypothetical protein